MTLPLLAQALDRSRIEAQAQRMGLTITLPEQFAFLEARGPLHLQAAPGSGKTTLVALKLALVAEEWSSTRQGICVLSHTNTATQEIVGRLSGRAQRLLRYPHFVGTIQSFIHTFVALPALPRSQQVTARAIDDQVYSVQARRLLDLGMFRTLRGWARRRPDGLQIVTEATYVFEPDERQLQIPVNGLSRGATSYEQLLQLKQYLSQRGIFRYQDMYALAARHLHRHPRLVAGLRARFPFVLIDEMQDTDAVQSAILETIFGDAVVVQCVGDINQHIYSTGSSGTPAGGFPRQDAMELPVSQRFGPGIAQVATRLTVHRRQQIHGHGPDGTLVVLTFTEDTIERVVPAFERLVQSTIAPEIIAAHPPKVLGARGNPGTSRLFPRALSCYVPHWGIPSTPGGESRLLHAYRTATAMVLRDERHGPAAALLWETVRAFAWQLQAPTQPLRVPDGLPPLSQLDRQIGTPGHRIRMFLACALRDRHDDSVTWDEFIHQLMGLLCQLTGELVTAEAHVHDAWLSYTPLPNAAEHSLSLASPSTTARAKGETHCATLVLECATKNGRSHDLGSILPVITGAKPVARLNVSGQHAALTAFVAATRAKYLLALAVHRDRADPHRLALARDGWIIRDL